MQVKILSDWDDQILEKKVENFLNEVGPYYDIKDIELTTQHRTKVLVAYGAQTTTSTGLPDEITVIKYFFCDTSANIGDVVRMSKTIDYKVIVTTDNMNIRPAIGIIISKVTDTICSVLILGECPVNFPGLTKGKRVFHSTSGSIIDIAPITGFLQVLGFAVSSQRIYVKPSLERVMRR